MPKNYLLNEPNFKPSKTMTRDFDVELTLADGTKKLIEVKNNRTRLCRVPVNEVVTAVRFTPRASFGENVRVFSFELY